MHRRVRHGRLLLAVGALTALAGCSSTTAAHANASGPTLPPSTSTVAAPTTTAGPSLSPRGTLIKQLGEQAGWGSDAAHEIVTFTVDSIAPVTCDAPYHDEKPTGTLVAAHMRMSTQAGASLTDLQSIPMMNSSEWEFVGSDGITHSGQEIADMATYGCVKDSEAFPDSQLAPGSQYVGDLVFDLPGPHGALIYAPGGLNDAHGWEWDF